MLTEHKRSAWAGDGARTGWKQPKHGERALLAIVASTHSGMTSDEFDETVHQWLVYLPMLPPVLGDVSHASLLS